MSITESVGGALKATQSMIKLPGFQRI